MTEHASNVRGLVETRRGAHFARNSGAMAARGTILYFTDDDMLPHAAMLETIVTAFPHGSRVGSATGRILPVWETKPPRWVLEHCRNALLSLNDRGRFVQVGLAAR